MEFRIHAAPLWLSNRLKAGLQPGAIAAALPGSVETRAPLAMMGNGMMHNGMGWMMMLMCILGVIIALLLIVLLVLLIVYVIKKMRQ